MTGKELVKILRKNGWKLDRISGSHHIMKKEGERSVPVSIHANRELPKGYVHDILKQAKIKK